MADVPIQPLWWATPMIPVRHHPVDADADRIMPGEVLTGGALVVPVGLAEDARGEAPFSTSRFTPHYLINESRFVVAKQLCPSFIVIVVKRAS